MIILRAIPLWNERTSSELLFQWWRKWYVREDLRFFGYGPIKIKTIFFCFFHHSIVVFALFFDGLKFEKEKSEKQNAEKYRYTQNEPTFIFQKFSPHSMVLLSLFIYNTLHSARFFSIDAVNYWNSEYLFALYFWLSYKLYPFLMKLI